MGWLPTFPSSARVDRERVQDHGKGRNTAEGRVILCPELLGQAKVALHVAFDKGLAKELAAVDRTANYQVTEAAAAAAAAGAYFTRARINSSIVFGVQSGTSYKGFGVITTS